MSAKPVYIVEEIGKVVDATKSSLSLSNLLYIYGHPLEVMTRLQEMTNSVTQKDKKFPLIALFTDVTVRVNAQTVGIYGEVELQLIIATQTLPEYTSVQRLETSFKPTLYPIRDSFLDNLLKHRQFTFDGNVEYDSIDRFYWGRQGLYGNTGNIFNDYIDAIEIQNLRVRVKNKVC
jgi:hypothetical protein